MPESQLQPLTVDDFSGGMTDRYISAQPTQFQAADNYLLRMHGGKGKLITRPGSEIYDTASYQIPAGNQRLVDMEVVDSQLFQMSARAIYLINPTWLTLTGPTGNPALSAGATTDYISKATWNKHLIVANDAFTSLMKVYKDETSTWRVRNLGLPEIDTTSVTATPGVPAARAYSYAFIRSDSYMIGTKTFREVSAVTFKNITNGSDPSVSTIAIANIPVLANGATGNYNTSTSKIEIYRNENAGAAWYKTGEVTNGTTTFNDTRSDASLILQEPLYTTGDVVDYEQVDPCKYVAVNQSTAYYGHVKEDGVVYPNRIRLSIPGALYASPRDFYCELEEENVGIGVAGQYTVAFAKEGKIYRLEGTIDDQGQGDCVPREISRTVTLASNRSIVPVSDGCFFAAEDGFYFTDGFQVTKISEEIPDSYSEIVQTAAQKARIYGAYDSKEKRVHWAVTRDSGSADNDAEFVAEIRWGIKPNTPFLTASGWPNVSNYQPTCLKFINGQKLRGDPRGYLFLHDDNYLSDPKVDTTTSPANWYKAVIYPDYRSPAFDFGTNEYRKWVSEIVLMADNETNVAIQIATDNDNSGSFNDLAIISYTSEFTWGDESFVWGDPDFRWNYSTVIDAWRRMPSGGLRCNFKQIKITPGYATIDTEAVIGNVSTDATLKTVTLDNGSLSFLDDPIDYYISFDSDNFQREFLIISRDSDTQLTVSDPSSLFETLSSRRWKIRGYRKDEIISLLSYTMRYAYLGRTQKQVNVS